MITAETNNIQPGSLFRIHRIHLLLTDADKHPKHMYYQSNITPNRSSAVGRMVGRLSTLVSFADIRCHPSKYHRKLLAQQTDSRFSKCCEIFHTNQCVKWPERWGTFRKLQPCPLLMKHANYEDKYWKPLAGRLLKNSSRKFVFLTRQFILSFSVSRCKCEKSPPYHN